MTPEQILVKIPWEDHLNRAIPFLVEDPALAQNLLKETTGTGTAAVVSDIFVDLDATELAVVENKKALATKKDWHL